MSEPMTREPHQSADLARHRPRIAQVLGGAVLSQSRRFSFRSWRRAAARTARSRNSVHTTIQQPCVSSRLHIAAPNKLLRLRTRGSSHRFRSQRLDPRHSSSSSITLPAITPSTSIVDDPHDGCLSLCQVILDQLGEDALAKDFKSKICEVRARRVSILARPLSDPQQRELAAHGRLHRCVLLVACIIPPLTITAGR